MQFIDKQNIENESKGNAIVNKFLEDQWDDSLHKYINLDYSTFENKEMKKLVSKEQSDFCCYCMRRLTAQNITLEHIIPNNIKSKKDYLEEVKRYMDFSEVLRNNISVWDEQKFSQLQTTPPFPHFVAYQNLVASCNGELIDKNESKLKLHQCCNNRRENDFVIPYFYIPDIVQEISYTKEGDIIYKEELEDSIKRLNLNDSTLKLLRKAWYFLGKTVSVTEIEAGKNILKRREILDEADINQAIKNTLLSDIYWNLFCEYKWFHSYYYPN